MTGQAMTGQEAELILRLDAEPEDDAEEIAELTQQLRKELLELDVEVIDFVSAGEIPARAKTGDPVAWGELVLTLAASGGVLVTLINTLQYWLTRQDRSKLTIEIDGDKLEVPGNPTEEQKKIIDAWLSRHRGFVLPND